MSLTFDLAFVLPAKEDELGIVQGHAQGGHAEGGRSGEESAVQGTFSESRIQLTHHYENAHMLRFDGTYNGGRIAGRCTETTASGTSEGHFILRHQSVGAAPTPPVAPSALHEEVSA